MMKPMCLAVAATALLPALAEAQTTSASKRVESQWFDYEIRWTQGAPSYTAKWMVVNQRGQIVICGAGSHRGGKNEQNRKILQDLALFVEEKAVMTDMSFFASAKKRQDIVGSNAACLATGKRAADYPGTNVTLRKTRPGRKYETRRAPIS